MKPLLTKYLEVWNNTVCHVILTKLQVHVTSVMLLQTLVDGGPLPCSMSLLPHAATSLQVITFLLPFCSLGICDSLPGCFCSAHCASICNRDVKRRRISHFQFMTAPSIASLVSVIKFKTVSPKEINVIIIHHWCPVLVLDNTILHVLQPLAKIIESPASEARRMFIQFIFQKKKN